MANSDLVVQADLAALPSDDECASGQCALNALQVRSQEGPEFGVDAFASALERPTCARMVPVFVCLGRVPDTMNISGA